MTTTRKIITIGIISLLFIGCGKSHSTSSDTHVGGPEHESDSPIFAIHQDKEDDVNMRLIASASEIYVQHNDFPPSVATDIEKLIEKNGNPIDYDRYQIIWRVDTKSYKDPVAVLGYVKDVPQKGGLVVFTDHKVRRVSAEEFQELPQAKPVQPIADRKVDLSVTADDFLAEQKKSGELEWRKKYRGKVVELKGIINQMRHWKTSLSHRFILMNLNGSDESGSFYCLMQDKKDEIWAKFSKGQQVTVKGLVADMPSGDTIVQCSVVQAGPNKAIRMTAEELAKKQAEEKYEFWKKYSDNSFIITGEIVSVNKSSVGLKGAGDKPIIFSFEMISSFDDWKKKIVPGTKIKLYAECYELAREMKYCEFITE